MSDPNSVIAANDIVQALQPAIDAFVASLVGAIVLAAASIFNSWKARWLQESAEERAQDEANAAEIAKAVANEATKIVAKSATDEFKNKTFTLGSPEVTQAANMILGAQAVNLKTALDDTKATQTRLQSLVLGKIGDLQVKMSAPKPDSAPEGK